MLCVVHNCHCGLLHSSPFAHRRDRTYTHTHRWCIDIIAALLRDHMMDRVSAMRCNWLTDWLPETLANVLDTKYKSVPFLLPRRACTAVCNKLMVTIYCRLVFRSYNSTAASPVTAARPPYIHRQAGSQQQHQRRGGESCFVLFALCRCRLFRTIEMK